MRYFIPEGTQHAVILEAEFPEMIANARQGVKWASESEVARNQLFHSNWIASPHVYGLEGKVIRIKQRTKADKTLFQEESINSESILATVEKMNSATTLIFMSANHLNVWLRMRKAVGGV
jgi:hypothetical protein